MIDLDDYRRRNEERRKRRDAATNGPWLLDDPGKETEGPAKGWRRGAIVAAVARGQYVYTIPQGGVSPERDRAFIAASRTDPAPEDIDALIAEVERLRAELADIEPKEGV
jgi:hypothetical protein